MENQELDRKVEVVLKETNEIIFRSAQDVDIGNRGRQAIRRMMTEIKDTFNPIIDLTKEKRDRYLAPLAAREKQIKAGIETYLLQAEIERRREEARLREIAEKELVKEIEKVNKKIEKLEKEKEQIKITDYPSMMKFEVISEKIKALQSQETQIRPSIPAAAIQKTEIDNLTYKTVKVAVFDENSKKMIIKAVAEGHVPESVLDINIVNVNKLINNGIIIPGVRVTEQVKTRTYQEK